MASIQITDSQMVPVTLSYADKRSNPTPPPAGIQTPAWVTDNTDLVALTPSADGMNCTITALGPLGSCTVAVKAADSNGNPLAGGSLDVTVVSGAPVTITVTPGTPTEQP